ATKAGQLIETAAGSPLGVDRSPELVLLPLDDGATRLVWVGEAISARSALRVFVDAKDGTVVRRVDLWQRQFPNAFVGHGVGVLGDDKKLSTNAFGGGFVLFDTLRPPDISTFDMRSNLTRAILLLNGAGPAVSDLSFSSGNDWND